MCFSLFPFSKSPFLAPPSSACGGLRRAGRFPGSLAVFQLVPSSSRNPKRSLRNWAAIGRPDDTSGPFQMNKSVRIFSNAVSQHLKKGLAGGEGLEPS